MTILKQGRDPSLNYSVMNLSWTFLGKSDKRQSEIRQSDPPANLTQLILRSCMLPSSPGADTWLCEKCGKAKPADQVIFHEVKKRWSLGVQTIKYGRNFKCFQHFWSVTRDSLRGQEIQMSQFLNLVKTQKRKQRTQLAMMIVCTVGC